MTRRNYRSSLAFVEEAFSACWANSQDLVKASKLLLDTDHEAQSLSLSVLALEELGKLFCVDGLLFARADDEKAKTFAKALKSHAVKLRAFELFPLLLMNIARTDPRYGTEERFNQAIAIAARDLKARGNAVFELLPGARLDSLDEWKQLGFYAQPSQGTFRTPREAIDSKLANAVYLLAWRASTSLDFLLKAGNLERYIAVAASVRTRMSEADHQRLTEFAEGMFKDLFPNVADTGGEGDLPTV